MNMLALIMAVVVAYIAKQNDFTWTEAALLFAFVYVVFAII